MIDNKHLPAGQDSAVKGPEPETVEAPFRRRAAFYVDGFNLYHAIDDIGDNRIKWLDLRSLCLSFLRDDDTLVAVNFFTALSRWDKAKRQRHLAYIKALQQTGVNVIVGTFDRQSKFCWVKSAYCKNYSEKKTDVAVAVSLIADGFENRYDKAFLISADSDHVPLAERFFASLPHKRLLHIAPPKRFSEARELASVIDRSFHLTVDRLRQHLFPPEFRSADGRLIVARPAAYE